MNEHRRAPPEMTHSLYSAASPLPPPLPALAGPPRVFIRASSDAASFARAARSRASARARQRGGPARHLPASLNLAGDRVESSPLDRQPRSSRGRRESAFARAAARRGAFQIRRDFVTRFTKGEGSDEENGRSEEKGRGANELSLSSFSCSSPSRTCAEIRRDRPRPFIPPRDVAFTDIHQEE